MRGNKRSSVLMLAPPLDLKEYENGGLPLSNHAALRFHEILEEECGISTDRDCIVVSCSRYGTKANKASTDGIKELVRQATLKKQTEFKIVMCVGDEAFKHIFGRSKKPSGSLYWNVMFVEETNYLPLYVFPPLEGLHVNFTGDRWADSRLSDWQSKTELTFRQNMRKLNPFIKTL